MSDCDFSLDLDDLKQVFGVVRTWYYAWALNWMCSTQIWSHIKKIGSKKGGEGTKTGHNSGVRADLNFIEGRALIRWPWKYAQTTQQGPQIRHKIFQIWNLRGSRPPIKAVTTPL